MPCFTPARIPSPYSPKAEGVRIIVPCGRCLGCLLARGRDWTVRCLHESRYHDSTLFLTLTYDDEHLHQYLSHPSLNPPDMQRFFKRLRKAGHVVRYLYCGEYGEVTDRPHYHAIVFGLVLSDLKVHKRCDGYDLYTSAILESTWKMGNCLVAFATPETMAYTAGYTVKKLFGPDATTYYASRGQCPPYIRMSRRPGIGQRHAHDYRSDIASQDTVYLGEMTTRVPRYYDKQLRKIFSGSGPDHLDPSRATYVHRGEPLYSHDDPRLRAELRMIKAIQNRECDDRLLVKQAVALARYRTYSGRSSF